MCVPVLLSVVGVPFCVVSFLLIRLHILFTILFDHLLLRLFLSSLCYTSIRNSFFLLNGYFAALVFFNDYIFGIFLFFRCILSILYNFQCNLYFVCIGELFHFLEMNPVHGFFDCQFLYYQLLFPVFTCISCFQYFSSFVSNNTQMSCQLYQNIQKYTDNHASSLNR